MRDFQQELVTSGDVMNKIDSTPIKKAKFNVGDVVVHQRQGYRAVVIDIDLSFQPSGHYHRQTGRHLLTKPHPWYRLLVDECSQETYVEEPLLKRDFNAITIENPQIGYHLIFKTDKYHMLMHKH